jgi:hypothetical protein
MKITPSLALPFGLVLTVAAAAVAQVTGSTALTVGNPSNGHYDGTVKVSGNKFVNGSGQVLKLAGINTEYFITSGTCVTSQGDSDYLGHVAVYATWKVNIVRIPLDEDCWLNINGVSGGGAAYQNAVQAYVTALHAHNMYALLSLVFGAPGAHRSMLNPPLPDSDHSPAFWSQVATAYKNDRGVMFDVLGEPNGITFDDTGWGNWINGCSNNCAWDSKHNVGYNAPGAQSLINNIRTAGATTQPITVAGLAWSQEFGKWLQFKPTDTSNSIAASIHLYAPYSCAAQSCYSAMLGKILNTDTPVMTGEFGDFDCTDTFSTPYMNWADHNGVGYIAWVWRIAGCGEGPSLITNYTGTPTNYGAGIKGHFIAINP